MSADNIFFADPSINEETLEKAEKNDGWFEENSLVKSLVENLRTHQKEVQPIAFDTDPSDLSKYSGMYIDKSNTPLLPDIFLKKIFLVNELVSAVVRARSNHISSFGHPLQDRYSQGFRLDPIKNSGFAELPMEKKADLIKRALHVSKNLETCGNHSGLDAKQKQSFPEFLYMSAANAVKFGRITTEILRDYNNKFCGFRAIDPSTIYFSRPRMKGGDNLRDQAIKKLKELLKDAKDLDFKKIEEGEYSFVQVINGVPQNVFTSDEMLNTNFYPTTDIECNYYPVTPIDTVVNSVITHINITNHNKLYFQNGRAAKGMIIIQSDQIKDTTIAQLKQSFNATINSVQNSWRVPVIKVGKEEVVQWSNIDATQKDSEFQYLYDSNIRVILAAFNMSPEELPGFNHLSKGTNNQSLSESNNEYKLEAARDVGIRPLLSTMENFMNNSIIPLFDKELSKYFKLRFFGLDSETPEREATRVEKEQQLWGTFNDTLRSVEKDEVPKHLGGDFPMALAYSQVLDKYVKVGEILEHFFGLKDASKDPQYDYIRDQFYMQKSAELTQIRLAEQQKQMAEQMQGQGQQGGQPQNQGSPNTQESQQNQQGQPDPELDSHVNNSIKAFSGGE